MNIALIPARGGSKRVPGKNTRHFHGRPIIAYSIAAAHEAECFDKVMVSTDDDAIANVAISYGAEVLERPAELADDHTIIVDVLRHALQHHQASLIACIYATAPMVQAEDLVSAELALRLSDTALFALSVTPYPFSPFRALKRLDDGRVTAFNPEHNNTRSQDLPQLYHDAAQFFLARPHAIEGGVPVYGDRTLGIDIPRERVVDIDSEEDWRRAELAYAVLKAREEQ